MHIREFTKSIPIAISVVLFSFAFYSCTTPKKLIYFEDLSKDTLLRKIVTKDFELKIRKSDAIFIGVASISPDLKDYNILPTNTIGYTLNSDGDITFPKLGIIHAEGMTRRELSNKLTKDLSPYLKDPIVTVNFTNQHVTMLGGIGSSQILPIVNEQLTLLDAIASSGDIKDVGRKDNILVIRQTENGKQFKRINLNDHSVFASQYYYLQPDDIVYVEPRKATHPVTTQEVLTYTTTALSLFFLILNSTRK